MASDKSFKQYLTAINPFGKGKGDTTKNLGNYIAPVQLQRLKQDVLSWREAIMEAENVFYPHRVKMQRLFIDTINNGHVFACTERRKDLTLLRKWEFVNSKGETDQYTTDIFQKSIKGQSQNNKWFNDFISYSFDAIYFGYSLVSLGDIENDSFPNLDIIKRWNVSPDRLNVTNFTYSISGALFNEEPYKDWHIYVKTVNDIGTSPCGYGLLYKVALYEVFLRNILGQNADFTELFAQPYRVGKTTKTGKEREHFAQAIQDMGSAGWAMIDPEDEILFLETALGGTGYKAYSEFEQRLEKKISKLILGHSDALDSIAGKLGNSNEKSPAELALQDKQSKDGVFITDIVNSQLIPKMRKHGFAIPDDVVAILKNDAEVTEITNSIIDQAVKLKSAGLVMDALYFTEKTGIPVNAEVASAKPITPPTNKLDTSIKNKLESIYNHNNCNCSH